MGEALPVTHNDKLAQPLSFDELIRQYNAMPVVKLIGAPQLDSHNHGRNVRSEAMVRKAQ